MSEAVAAVHASLAEIERSEARVRAWVHVDAEQALNQAAEIDRRRSTGATLPLAGLTVGIKDIIDVAGMPTVAGFVPFEGRIAATDATVTARLRAAGATILGKTTTTQFAVADPTDTRNPWNLERTPAGSSSGSAAAVAARHVDLAIGTQTAGSTLRPASFCGIVGFKPSFGWIARSGVIPLGDTLDTIGLMARDIDTVALMFDLLADHSFLSGTIEPESPTNIGFWEDAAQMAVPEVRHAVDIAMRRAVNGGASVQIAPPPADYRDLLAIHHITMLVDAAAAHQKLIQRYPDAYGPRVRSFVEVGLAIPAHTYGRVQMLRREFRERALAEWGKFDLIALPTAETPAPGLETTGSPSLQAVVTLFGLPAITLPVGLSSDGLPIGLQLVATSADGDAHLLRAARWFESILDPLPMIPYGIRD